MSEKLEIKYDGHKILAVATMNDGTEFSERLPRHVLRCDAAAKLEIDQAVERMKPRIERYKLETYQADPALRGVATLFVAIVNMVKGWFSMRGRR